LPTRSHHWGGEADYVDGPAWGKPVPSGLACGDTEHSIFCSRKSGSFHQRFCISFALSFWFVFLFFFLKKKGNHNPNSALAKPDPFKERKFPRATLSKPGGPILLSGMSVQMQGGSADCWGVIAAEQGSSLGEKLPVSCLDMEQSSHQSSLRANSGFKGNEQQKGPTPNFKNSSKVAEPRSGSTSPILL